MDDRQLKRAGLDYHEHARVALHPDWKSCLASFSGRRVFALTTKGKSNFFRETFVENDVFVFGSETAGLPEEILRRFPERNRLRLPMQPGNRSLNLSNAVAVAVFEAWRQLGFPSA